MSFLLIIVMGFTHELLKYPGYCLFLCLILVSCTVVKNAPTGKPFVYDNKVNVKGNISKDEKKRLTTDLANYWDDSLNAQKIQQFGVRYVLKRPPVFDTVNLYRTQRYMTGYLNSQGYYKPNFLNLDSSYRFDTVKEQIRTSITLDINPGKTTIIDSLLYNLDVSFLDSITIINARRNSLIKPGKTPFSKQIIASELDRLVALYRQRGFFLLTRDNLVAEVDTTDLSLLQIVVDPFEQAQRIAEAAERRNQNPTCIVVIRKKEPTDSAGASEDSVYFKRYHIGNIYYYPETGRYDLPDSLMKDTASFFKYVQNYSTLYYKRGLFVFQPLREHTFQRKGAFYNEENFFKTLNNFNQVGAWERIDYRTALRNDSIDFHYFLTPAKRETISLNLETSRNTGDFLTTGNLIGIAFNISYQNRNLWRKAIQSITTFSNGVEFSYEADEPLLQTFQTSLNHTFSFPRFIAPFKIKNINRLDGIKTQFVLSASYSDRKDFFILRSLVSSWGYEWRKKNIIWSFRPLNVEIYSLDTLPGLEEAFKTNPFLKTSFNSGTVISQQASVIISYPSRKHKNAGNYIRLAAEQSGGLLWKAVLNDELYEYIKFEAEYRRLYTYTKSALTFRVFGGIGYNYGNSERFGKTLPFFKQYAGGGPNSMRAWGLRLLGLGSSVVADTAKDFRDRYGDMQLEANAEYRFIIAQFSGVKIGSAVFTDVGNIWNIFKSSEVPNSEFSFKRLGQDIAVGIGTGLRFDFNYFLIRLDFGIKLKDPARYIENNGWLKFRDFTWKNYLYGKTNPSTGEYSPQSRNNYALQLGIGMPF